MQRLDYQQLRCFHAVAFWGGVGLAADQLKLPAATLTTQIRAFESAIGKRLLQPENEGMAVTGFGRTVLTYAEEIFEAEEKLLGYAADAEDRELEPFIVGLPDVIPKLIAGELLKPAIQRAGDFQLVCREGSLDELLTDLANHRVDVILSDCPASPAAKVPAQNQWLGKSGVTIFGTAELVAKYREGFPDSLKGASMLLPALKTAARRKFDLWAEKSDRRPRVIAEFDDTALLKVVGKSGIGLFPSPTAIVSEVCQQYQVEALGELEEVYEEFFAISLDRRLKHPLVTAITRGAESGALSKPART